jgi:hypothetical protein
VENGRKIDFFGPFSRENAGFLAEIIKLACGAVTLVEGRVFWHVF